MTTDFDDSTFTLTTKEDFDTMNDPQIESIIKKYNIITNEDKLLSYSETNFISLIDYIDHCYYLKQELQEDIKDVIKYHTYFNKYLISYVDKKLDFILKNGSAVFFKDIVSIINLLSRGEKYNIFENYDTYNYDEIGRLFREYEAFLQESFSISKEFSDVAFSCYNCLLKLYNKLCLINSTDIKRKKTITPITDMLTETINMTKFTVKLDESHLNHLNNILGQILYYFSHLPFVDIANKDLNYVIDQYYLLIEKTSDGYNLSKETDFAGNTNSKEEEYLIFRSNLSYLFLIMFKKLKANFNEDDYFINESLKKCILLYETNFKVSFLDKKNISLKIFYDSLIDSIALSYETNDGKIGQIGNYKAAVSDFILESDNYNIHNLETIHDIFLLADPFDESSYINIGKTLVNSKLITNDYYEFYKLKTLDIIVNNLKTDKQTIDAIDLVKDIEEYIEKYKTASHLMGMFSKLYLSIAYYYSKFEEKDFIHKARDIYVMFVNINGFDLLKEEYKFINNRLLKEFGVYHLDELNFSNDKTDEKELISLGKIGIKNYIKYSDLKTKYNINKELSNITSSILQADNLNYEKLNFQISSLLVNKIFYGICEISIRGLTKKSSSIIDEGYKIYQNEIDEDYSLQFIFPAVYENNFKYILDENKTFIVQNLSNILSSYKKESFNFINKSSGLQNLHKLHLDLKNKEGEDINFINIYVKSFPKINDTLGFKIGDKYLQTITNKIDSMLGQNDEIYYLNNGKVGILLDNKDKINSFLDKITRFKLHKNGEEMNIELVISVTVGKYNIFEKSMATLDKAIISKNNLLFYEQ